MSSERGLQETEGKIELGLDFVGVFKFSGFDFDLLSFL